MEAAVNDIDLNIDDRITAEHAVEHGFLDTLLDCWNVLARNDAADNFVFDHQTFPAIARTHINFDMSVLTAAA